MDDNVDAALSLASVLGVEGHSTAVYHNGLALLDALESLPPQDLFILDIGLPQMDGFELVRRLRALPLRQGARMSALTGYEQSHDRAIGLVAGFDDYFVRPMDIRRFNHLLANVIPPN